MATVWSAAFTSLTLLLAALPSEAATDCTPFSRSLVYIDADYAYAGHLLDITGVSQTLSHLSASSTLFAPRNAAFDAYHLGSNISLTSDEAAGNSLSLPGAQLLVVPGQYYSALQYFQTGQVLPTLNPDNSLTVRVEQVNSSTERYTIVSPSSAGTIISGPFYACNLVIYGTNGNLVTKENIQNPDLTGAVHNITNYLITLLAPGGPSVPISAIILAAQRNNGTAEVAAAFNAAVAAGYIPQLEALLKQAVGVPKGVATLASVANEMAVQAGCNTVLPLIRDLYPAQYSSADSLQLTQAELQSIPAMDPKLTSCVGA